MAIFQFHMQIIGRSEGRSVVAAAAYRSASKIENKYTGIIEDYTQKNWVEYSEIMLPEHAPESFHDRAILWNSVETVERDRDARLAREIEVALPKELSMIENIELIQSFVKDTFVSDGMIADVSIHNPPVTDKSGHPVDSDGNPVKEQANMIFCNPHAHILLTVRPIGQDGKWLPKTQKEYLCKKGNIEKAFTSEEFKKAKIEGWQKQYQYWLGKKKVWLTATAAYEKNLIRVSKNPRSTPYGRRDAQIEKWNSQKSLLEYRLSWEEHVNHALEKAGSSERVDSRSYKDQGVDTVSSIHLGPHASRLDEAVSDKQQINKCIESLNQENVSIRKTLDNLENEIKNKRLVLYEKLSEKLDKLRADIISTEYSLALLTEHKTTLIKDIERLDHSVNRILTAQKVILEKDKLAQENISKLQNELQGSFPLWSKRPNELRNSIQTEQDGIKFRNQRFIKILEEEKFSNIFEFQQKSDILKEMKKTLEQLEQDISSFEKVLQKHIYKFEDLCKYIPEDVASLDEFDAKQNNWSHKYEQMAAEHIQKHTGHLHMKTFQNVLKKTDRSLSHAFYFTSRASHLLNKAKEVVDEQDGKNHRRNP